MPSESYTSGLNFEETELSLCLPGETRSPGSSKKRGFSENVDLTLGCSGSGLSFYSKLLQGEYPSPNEMSNAANKPPAKAQVVGWPPVKSSRMNMMVKISKYVKVAADGAPYLRKIDLEMYNNYKQLLAALEDMFTCLTICNVVNMKMLMDAADGMSQCVASYEDRDGDWMLVGDVPWKMFVESCKRIRLMKSSGAIELPANTSANCSSTCWKLKNNFSGVPC